MIEFSRPLYDAVIDHAHRGGAEEICGILGGTFGEDGSVVTSIYEAENVADTPETRYYIDPEEQFELVERLEGAGEAVVGFYHSHPAGPSRPSVTDADRATWPNRSYVIVALDGHPYVGSWRWLEAGQFELERVSVTPDG